MNPVEAIRKALLVLVVMVAFAGLWQWLAPYRGPANSMTSGDTATIVRGGFRVSCAPALFLWLSDPMKGDKEVCLSVGVLRLNVGWMLLLTAGVGAVATAIFFRQPSPDPQEVSHEQATQ